MNAKEKLWHWLTCEGRTSTLHHEEEYSSNCRQMITRQVMNSCAVCCNTACTARRRNWEEELASTFSDLKLTRGIACPCVWQGCIKGEHLGTTSRLVENDRQWNSSSKWHTENTRSRNS